MLIFKNNKSATALFRISRIIRFQMINTNKYNNLKNQINKSKRFKKTRSNAMSLIKYHTKVKWATLQIKLIWHNLQIVIRS